MSSAPVKPFVQACENNKVAIADTLEAYVRNIDRLLEIGSGTGQHAVYFAGRFPNVTWQTSDLAENHAGIRAWIEDSHGKNLPAPITCDLAADIWDVSDYDAIYAANVVHIIETCLVERLFEHATRCLADKGLLILYGPFNYQGRFTSAGNRRLDAWLKNQSPGYGIRDFEWIDELARGVGLCLLDDCAMPANNRTLIWQRL